MHGALIWFQPAALLTPVPPTTRLPVCLQSAQVLDVVDELFSPSKRPDVAYLWKSQRERSAWQVRWSGVTLWRPLGVGAGWLGSCIIKGCGLNAC